jgi:excisionase family DNA binding protein
MTMSDHRNDDLPRLRTIREAAERLKVSTRSIRRWIDLGEIPVFRLGRAVRISEEDLQAFLNRNRWGSTNISLHKFTIQ